MIVTVNGREVAKAEAASVLADASRSFLERRDRSLLERRAARVPAAPDRRSVSRAMLAVEERLVKAFWTIARQPIPVNASPRQTRRCGVDYFHDHTDSLARFIDAAGGRWDTVAPRPSLPSSKSIDEANRALDWLLLIRDESRRKLLVVGATSKRGDAGRNINWNRLRQKLPEFADLSTRTLQRYYQDGLRGIVVELTLSKVA